MFYTDTIIPICLAIIFFILFLSSNKKDKSILLMSIFFGVMSIDHNADNVLKGTKFETTWKIFYCLMMIVLIVFMTRDIITKIKRIKTRTKSNK